MDKYRSLRPRGSEKFFVRMDGQQVTRNEFCHFLDACLLHTRWRFLHVVPHALRVGGASEARKRGYDILTVKFIGRWTYNSSSIEAYTRLNLISIDPILVQRDKPTFVKSWKWNHLTYIARNTVQTKGSRDTHPHTQMLKKYFPDYWSLNEQVLPKQLPGVPAAYRLLALVRNRRSGVYLSKALAKEQHRVKLHNFRMELSKMAKQAAVLSAAKMQQDALQQLRAVRETNTTHESVEVQTTVIQTVEVAIQVDLSALQTADLTPLQPVPVEQIADFGMDLDVAEVCQLQSLPISAEDLQAEMEVMESGQQQVWTLFTPEEVEKAGLEQSHHMEMTEVDQAMAQCIQADVDRLCQLIRKKPLATRPIQQANDLIQVQHVEFSQLTYYGNTSLFAQGPLHRSWDDIEKNYEEYVVQSLNRQLIDKIECKCVFRNCVSSQARFLYLKQQ